MSEKTLMHALELSLKNRKNVILTGEHGVGKTHMVQEVFDKEFGRKGWAYFSAPTMDPFIDFMGCPKEVEDEDGTKYLDMVRPRRFAKDEVQAIFMDEFNRAESHIKNAVMELIQFKALNGVEYPNLKVIWVAINPVSDDYDTERMDFAQESRFHVHLEVPYQPSRPYFAKKYGASVANGAIAWWDELRSCNPELSKKVSPRTLDYALDGFINNNMDLKLFLPKGCNIKDLRTSIKEGPTLEKLLNCETNEEKTDFFKDENNYIATKDWVEKPENMDAYLHFWPKERIASYITKKENYNCSLTILAGADAAGNKDKFIEVIQDTLAVAKENDKEFYEWAQDIELESTIELFNQ